MSVWLKPQIKKKQKEKIKKRKKNVKLRIEVEETWNSSGER